MNKIKESIRYFLNEYCIKAAKDEDPATTELYMDDHDCIEFEDQEWYIPENNSFMNEDDELLREMIVNTL